MTNKLEDIFLNIKLYINYILNDEYLIYQSNYFKCLQAIYDVLIESCHRIQNIYYEYVLYPKLCQL